MLHGGIEKPREIVALAAMAELHGDIADELLLVIVVEATISVVEPLSHPESEGGEQPPSKDQGNVWRPKITIVLVELSLISDLFQYYLTVGGCIDD